LQTMCVLSSHSYLKVMERVHRGKEFWATT
jgi:hypothetical protein